MAALARPAAAPRGGRARRHHASPALDAVRRRARPAARLPVARDGRRRPRPRPLRLHGPLGPAAARRSRPVRAGVQGVRARPWRRATGSPSRLRANPVVTRADPREGRQAARHDVVMDRLHACRRASAPASGSTWSREAGRDWLARQGERAGFALVGEPRVDGYEQLRIDAPRASRRSASPSSISTARSRSATRPPSWRPSAAASARRRRSAAA